MNYSLSDNYFELLRGAWQCASLQTLRLKSTSHFTVPSFGTGSLRYARLTAKHLGHTTSTLFPRPKNIPPHFFTSLEVFSLSTRRSSRPCLWEVLWQAQETIHEITFLCLQPQTGRVSVEVDMNKGAATCRITADRLETLELEWQDSVKLIINTKVRQRTVVPCSCWDHPCPAS